ncbi:MAG: amidohydrolase family protein [Pseudomonadota bacterium]
MAFLTVMLLTACDSTRPQDAAPASAADLVLMGGNVVTVDADFPRAQAIAVQGSTILAVGSDRDLQGLIGANTQVIQLKGRTVIPGLIEGHGHYLGLGRAQQILDLNQAEKFTDIVNQVGVAVDAAQPDEWVFGRGWHQDKWTLGDETLVDGVPVNQTLNNVSADNPVLLGHASGHAAYVNDAALAAAGITAQTPDPPGGTIVRDKLGRATGLLRETAQRLVQDAVAQYQLSLGEDELRRQIDEQVYLAGKVALAHGVTSFHDAGVDFATIDYFRQLEAEERLPIRLYAMVRGESNAEMGAKLADYFMPLEGNDFLTVRSIKRQIDGALGAHGAWLLKPYADLSGDYGLVLEPVEDIEETSRLAIEHGYQVNTHAIGTRANREVLDLYQRQWEAAGLDGRDLRWRIEHAQHIHPDDIPRFGQMGVIAAIQGVHCTSDGPWIPRRLGLARTEQTSYRWRDLIDSGARINNGTDAPVEAINPFVSLQASVDRVMADGQAFFPAQAMTREEALHSYTLGNAYSAFEDMHKGSITPGKLADLVVVDRDLMTVPANQIGGTQVEMTLVGGQIRYQR